MQQAAKSGTKPLTYTPAYNFSAEPGVPADLGGGLFWLRMPLPFELNHINLWLMESPTGWTLVDTGFSYADTQQLWEKLFATRFAAKPVEGIFITHFHPDHFGLAGWLSERAGVTARMTQKEYDLAAQLSGGGNLDALEAAYKTYYTEAGITEPLLSELLGRRFSYRKMIGAPPAAITPVRPGDTVTLGGRPWKIIGGYGHSPEHACLYDAAAKRLIAGDIVLPSITPNISLYPGSHTDPVGAYLDTLERIRAEVPDDVTVYPSHGEPFTGLHKRLDEMRAHHMRRFERLNTVLRSGPQTALEAMNGLFSHRELKGSDVFFALGETMAHLAHEQLRGRVVKTMKDGRGVYGLAHG